MDIIVQRFCYSIYCDRLPRKPRKHGHYESGVQVDCTYAFHRLPSSTLAVASSPIPRKGPQEGHIFQFTIIRQQTTGRAKLICLARYKCFPSYNTSRTRGSTPNAFAMQGIEGYELEQVVMVTGQLRELTDVLVSVTAIVHAATA